MDTIKLANKRSVRMIAHRGVSGIERENTAAAYVAAANRSYYGIETDVYATLDDQYVCIHDSTTKRVGIDDIDVTKATFETVRKIQLTDTDGTRTRADLHVPSLEEYLRICRRYGKKGILELKSDFSMEQLEAIVSRIQTHYAMEGVVFISFSLNNLLRLKTVYPDQPMQFLCGELRDDTLAILQKNQIGVDICSSNLTPALFAKIRAAGLEINCWTVDSPEEAARLIAMGVDYLTTNILE